MNVAPPFWPLPGLAHPHLQTVLGNTLSLARAPRSARLLVPVEGDDRVALEVSTPVGWRRDDPTVVLVHGLGGSHRSTYVVRLAQKLVQRGARAVRMNLRGQGSGLGLARRPYHAGSSDDVRAVALALRREEPRSPVTLVGFSLGGNMVVKLAGELGDEGPALLAGVVAVCPALDLARCADRIERPENALYERMFVRQLLASVLAREATFPDLPPARLPATISLRAFDHVYTAAIAGYPSGAAYYAGASALALVPRARVPLRLLFADDDPIVDRAIADAVRPPPGGALVRTPHGGHMGFLGLAGGHGVRWMDRLVVEWALGPAR